MSILRFFVLRSFESITLIRVDVHVDIEKWDAFTITIPRQSKCSYFISLG